MPITLKEQDQYVILKFYKKDYKIIKSRLYFNDEILLEIDNFELNFFTLNPNPNYICLVNKEYEVLYSIKEHKEVSPRLRGITPSPFFPKIPYYKFYKNKKHCIAHFPSNKVIFETKEYEDISSIDQGFLVNRSNLFYTYDHSDKNTYYYFENGKSYLLGNSDDLRKTFGKLDKKISNKMILKKILSM